MDDLGMMHRLTPEEMAKAFPVEPCTFCNMPVAWDTPLVGQDDGGLFHPICNEAWWNTMNNLAPAIAEEWGMEGDPADQEGLYWTTWEERWLDYCEASIGDLCDKLLWFSATNPKMLGCHNPGQVRHHFPTVLRGFAMRWCDGALMHSNYEEGRKSEQFMLGTYYRGRNDTYKKAWHRWADPLDAVEALYQQWWELYKDSRAYHPEGPVVPNWDEYKAAHGGSEED